MHSLGTALKGSYRTPPCILGPHQSGLDAAIQYGHAYPTHDHNARHGQPYRHSFCQKTHTAESSQHRYQELHNGRLGRRYAAKNPVPEDIRKSGCEHSRDKGKKYSGCFDMNFDMNQREEDNTGDGRQRCCSNKVARG